MKLRQADFRFTLLQVKITTMEEKGIKTVKHKNLTWINVEDPTPELLSDFKHKYGFHELDIEDVLSENQRSKVDEYEDYLFIILHIPFYDRKNQRVISEEVDIFIAKNLLVTLHWGSLKELINLFDDSALKETIREQYMSHGSGFLLYEILNLLYSEGFPIIDTVERGLASLEKDVFTFSAQRDMLKDILTIKKNIITFRRIIAPQRAVIAQLEHKNSQFLPDNLEVYFDDVVDKVEKIWNNLENLKDLVESLQETNESIISHNTNNVIKILTTFSVIMLPLTFMTGLYGMNVSLPLAEKEEVFGLLLIIMAGIVFSMLLFFKYKKWI